MSGASYRRGSASITRGLCQDYGCRGCIYCSEHTPTPRPSSWGEKALARATDKASRVIAAAERYGLPRPDVEMLATLLMERERVGADTARKAAEAALST